MTLTVACAQFSPKKAQMAANLDTIAALALQASGEGADLVLFPEASVTGYFLEGGVLECSFTQEELTRELAARLEGLPKALDIALGFYEKGDGIVHNSAAYFECGPGEVELKHTYRKFFLPTYGVFDEERFVAAGRELGVFDTRFGRVGFLICEDVWHSVLATLTAVAGAQLVLVPSASPARGFSGETIGNLDRYGRMLRAIGEEHGVFCVNTQLVGFEGGKGFVGGSSVIGPAGQVLAQSPIAEDHLLLAEIDLEEVAVARASAPLIADLRSVWADIVRLAGSV